VTAIALSFINTNATKRDNVLVLQESQVGCLTIQVSNIIGLPLSVTVYVQCKKKMSVLLYTSPSSQLQCKVVTLTVVTSVVHFLSQHLTLK